MMKQRLLKCAAFAALMPSAGNAGLQVAVNSSMLGNLCYSEDNEYSGARLIACGPSSMYSQDITKGFLYKCPSSYSDYIYESSQPMQTPTCYVGVGNNFLYICDTIESENSDFVCNYCGFNEVAWESVGNNRVRGIFSEGIENYSSAKNWTCTISKPYDYGCAAGYYQSGGSGASMICSRCPSSGGVSGHSIIGNTAITGCYIPAGNNFSDSTGTGIFLGHCYYTK